LFREEQGQTGRDAKMDQYSYNNPTKHLSAGELRERLANSRQPTLKEKLEERQQAEALRRMIADLRMAMAA